MTLCCFLFASVLFAAGQVPAELTPREVDEVLDKLVRGLDDYIIPDAAEKLRAQLNSNRLAYGKIKDPKLLAAKLTEDLRATTPDKHLQVLQGEELGFQKEPTPQEQRHAHAVDVARAFGVRTARRLSGNIGYIDFAYFSGDPDAGAAIAAAMQLVFGTDALVVDLRRNGGGGPASTVFLSYFFEEPVQLSSIESRVNGRLEERQRWTMPYVQGPRYIGKPVYVLTSRHTWSAAEQCAYDLKAMHRATIVGDRTGGAANSSSGLIPLGHGLSALIPNGHAKSPITHTNWDRVGVAPDVATPSEEALVTAYALALEASKPNAASEDLEKERRDAARNPRAALAEQLSGSPDGGASGRSR